MFVWICVGAIVIILEFIWLISGLIGKFPTGFKYYYYYLYKQEIDN